MKERTLRIYPSTSGTTSKRARRSTQFKLALKHLRYLLEPGAVQRRLGPDPGPAPQQAALRREWREDKKTFDAKAAKVEEHFAAALSALESSFAFATSPRHIIDVAIDNPPRWHTSRSVELPAEVRSRMGGAPTRVPALHGDGSQSPQRADHGPE